jgi:hypothetical protein
MGFSLPQFPLTVNVWRFGNATTNPPDVVTQANLVAGRRSADGDSVQVPAVASPIIPEWILVPWGTDIRGDIDTSGTPDTVEVASGDGKFYTVHYVQRVAYGFSNQHLRATLTLQNSLAPPSAGELLLEDGTDYLLEDGTLILLE